MRQLSQYVRALFNKDKAPKYRIVKENIFDEVALEMFTYYYIEKRNNVNWYQIGPKFEVYDDCIKYFTKYKEYLENKEATYEYLK